MEFRNLVVLLLIGLITVVECEKGKLEYPPVRRDPSVSDHYHGTKILDPYRWLEDPDSNETQEFVVAQNNLTQSYLERAPFRKQMRESLTKLWNYPKQGLPMKRGEKYYIFKNSGIQNQNVLYSAESLEGLQRNGTVFLDPNALSSDGTTALYRLSFSENGEFVAYTLSKAGSDWSDIHIRRVSDGKHFPEVLTFTKFTIVAWTHDNLGFFYNRYPAPTEETKLQQVNQNSKIYYHRLNTSQEEDTLMVEFLDKPDWTVNMEVTDDGEYLFVSTFGVINEDFIFYAGLKNPIKEGLKSKLNLIPLNTHSASFSFVTNEGPLFYFLTNEDAPNFRLIAMDVNNPGKDYWATLIPEHKKDVLQSAAPVAGNKMMTSYLRDVKSTLELRHLHNGTLIQEFPLGATSIQRSEGRRRDDFYYFEIASFVNPGASYYLNLTKEPLQLELYHQVKVDNFKVSHFVTTQVFYKSKDGTQIPMFLTHRKDLKMSGENPTLLNGYGGFMHSLEPRFSLQFLSFITNFDGILAIANIRGGGEYGTKWWDAGRTLNKQNSYDDFAAAAEYLIENKYTNPSKLSIIGASLGGGLIGTVLNQRPQLFGAGIPQVGVMDMLRLSKFSIESWQCGEYGCIDNKTHFDNFINHSPLHNIGLPSNGVQFPAVLVTTGDHDDRVVPMHSYKYISELQHTIGQSEGQTNPLLIRIEKNAGHGYKKPTIKQIEEVVDIHSFLIQALGLQYKGK